MKGIWILSEFTIYCIGHALQVKKGSVGVLHTHRHTHTHYLYLYLPIYHLLSLDHLLSNLPPSIPICLSTYPVFPVVNCYTSSSDELFTSLFQCKDTWNQCELHLALCHCVQLGLRSVHQPVELSKGSWQAMGLLMPLSAYLCTASQNGRFLKWLKYIFLYMIVEYIQGIWTQNTNFYNNMPMPGTNYEHDMKRA